MVNENSGSQPREGATADARDSLGGSPLFEVDSTPSNWFELAAVLCAEGHIGPDRVWNAVHAVRQAGGL